MWTQYVKTKPQTAVIIFLIDPSVCFPARFIHVMWRKQNRWTEQSNCLTKAGKGSGQSFASQRFRLQCVPVSEEKAIWVFLWKKWVVNRKARRKAIYLLCECQEGEEFRLYGEITDRRAAKWPLKAEWGFRRFDMTSYCKDCGGWRRTNNERWVKVQHSGWDVDDEEDDDGTLAQKSSLHLQPFDSLISRWSSRV